MTPWLAAIKQQEQIWLETCPNPHLPVCTKGKKVRCAADINMSNLGNPNIKHMSKIIRCTSTWLIEISFIRGAPARVSVHGLVLQPRRPHSKLGVSSDDSPIFQMGACKVISPHSHTFLKDSLINLYPHLEITLFKSKLIKSFAQ